LRLRLAIGWLAAMGRCTHWTLLSKPNEESPLKTPILRQLGACIAVLCAATAAQAQAALPIFISTNSYTGAGCISNGTSETTYVGGRLNTSPATTAGSYVTFDCPLELPAYFTDSSPVAYRLNVWLFANNLSAADQQPLCRLRMSTIASTENAVIDVEVNEYAPGSTASQLMLWREGSMPNRPRGFMNDLIVPYKAHLRCRLFNTNSAPRSGVLSYFLTVYR
jgi:hypothetical protein